MSEKDRFDWNDEADFESLADEPIEGFADFDDMEDFADAEAADDPPADADAVADRDESEAVTAAAAPETPAPRKRRAAPMGRSISGFELGFFFTVSVLVAAAGMGAAVLLAVGVNPVSLWQPDVFVNWQNYTRLTDNPLNVLAVIGVAVLILTLLGSQAFAKAAGRANARTREAEAMLERVTAMRLENEAAWQDPALKDYPAAATFAAETLGAWRLQHARHRHFTGIEGELHRLEKALAENSRSDLTGRFDSPAVGALADQMIRYFDEREAMARELAERQQGDEAEAAEAVRTLQEARGWQQVAADNVGRHGEALRGLAAGLEEFAASLAPAGGDDGAGAAVAACKTELENVCRALDGAAQTATPTQELVRLVDRSSKLAFQIAMEVARLGPRGERLGPMAQALEDLTTDFRQLTDKFHEDAAGTPSAADKLDRLAGRFADLEQAFRRGDDPSAEAARFAPFAAQLAGNLTEMASGCAPQAARLTRIGEMFAEMTGAAFDAAAPAVDRQQLPAGALSLEGRMPELGTDGGNIHQPADVDPFAVTPPPAAAPQPEPAADDFISGSPRPTSEIFGGGLDRASLPDLEIETSFDTRPDPFAAHGPAADAPAPIVDEPAAAPDLPAGDEKVYDLDDFSAEPVAEAADAGADDVVDLEAFGARPVDTPAHEVAQSAAQTASGTDGGARIYDLAEFGAVRLDEPRDRTADEEIHDLAEFGAVPLN